MNTIFDQAARQSILKRIETLHPSTKGVWGKMEIAQMLAHSSSYIEVASGSVIAKRSLIGKLIGGFFKSSALNDVPFSHGSPTDKIFIISEQKDFEKEKMRLNRLIGDFGQRGESKASIHPHPFFGHFTQKEWGIAVYKHLDHHLQQFGA